MNQIDTKELEKIISLYLDGELDQTELRKFEEYLANHPITAREVEILSSTKNSLIRKPKIAENGWFWLKLSNTIETIESHKTKSFFSSNSVYGVAATFMVTAILIGSIYFKDAPLFHRYFQDKSSQVQKTLMSGNVLPFFSNLNKDDVLNFALFGSISLDSTNKTALQVKNTSDKGSQIEIVRRDAGHSGIPITVADFCEDVGIVKAHQQLIVDSILGTYRQKLQGAILVSENNEIAIQEQLVDLNRVMVTTLAASLEPVQRVRFQKFLEERHAPYAVVTGNTPPIEPRLILEKMPKYASNNRYVVISKDTVGIAEMKMNLDSIRGIVHHQEMLVQREMTTRMLNEISSLHRQFENNVVVAGSNSNRVRIFSTDRAFQINLESPQAIAPDIEMFDMVRPRNRIANPAKKGMSGVTIVGDSAFTFEMTADDEAVRVFKRLPQGEFKFEIIDSAVKAPKMKVMFKSVPNKKEFEAKVREMQQREKELIDLDSLLRESEKENVTRQKKGIKVLEL